MSAIYDRRSIRKFLNTPLPKEELIEILQSGVKAPSSKNRQPWKFVVVQGGEKEEMLRAFRRGIAREENEDALLSQSRPYIAAAKYTIDIMEEAPVIVFVVNTLGKSILETLTPEERVSEICNVQSVSAAIQNMLLAATEKGIGSLWICDIYFAYAELCDWLREEGQLVAAVAFGYPNESPEARPRKKWEDVVVWRS
ncbi:MAG: nitroreductase family protein [Provencibacterium sp.]|nr:nitroreductase family protein [Provencibacterium sp.]